MINPASLFRIVGFVNKETHSIEQNPQEGGLVFCYTDNGKPLIIELKTNKPETTLEDIQKFLIAKKDSVVRSKDIALLASELSFFDEFAEEMFLAEQEYKENNPEAKPKDLMMFKKKHTEEKATQMVNDSKLIRKDTVVKTVIDINGSIDKKTYRLGNVSIPFVRSRSLIFQDGLPTTKGFYYYSQAENSLPVSVKKVFKADGEALNFFKITLSKLATISHFNFLAKHIIRTIDKQIEKKDKIYINIPEYNYERIKNNSALYGLIKRMTNTIKNIEITEDIANSYKLLFNELIEYINANPKSLIDINLTFNLVIDDKEFKKMAIEKSNPLTNLKNSIVNLNYSKEDPETKEQLKLIVADYLEDIFTGKRRGEILTTYFTIPSTLTEESPSWGFMSNNLQREAFVLSLEDTLSVSKVLDSALENIKNV